MKGRPWFWWFWIFVGTLPLGDGIKYFVLGGPAVNSSIRTALAVGEIIAAIAVIAFGLVKIVRSRSDEIDKLDEGLKITED